MRNFFKENRLILFEILGFSVFIAILLLVLLKNGMVFGGDGDFIVQHVRIIDYLRTTFWETNDLFLSWTMHFGGGQSYSTLMYYGYLNPIILISYALPFISTMHYLVIVDFFTIVLSFVGMRILLKMLKIRDNISLFLSIIYALAMPLMFHLGAHLMFAYYYPWMPLSICAMIYLIRTKKMWFFTITIALIFYFNFFFALIIGFVQLLIFIAYYLFYEDEEKKDLKQILPRYVCSYFLGFIVGLVVFIPQAIDVVSGSRTSAAIISDPIISFMYVKGIIFDKLYSGLVIIPIFSLVYSVLNYRDKFNLFISVVLGVLIIFMPFTLLLNFFVYNNIKIVMFIIPIFFILFGRIFTNNFSKIKIIIALIISLIIFFYIYYNTSGLRQGGNYYLYICVVQVFFILYLTFNLKFSFPIAIICAIIISSFNVANTHRFITTEYFENSILHVNQVDKDKLNDDYFSDGFYRNNSFEHNSMKNLNYFDSNIYVSIPNHYWNEFYEEMVLSPFIGSRQTSRDIFENYSFTKFLGIKNIYYFTEGKNTKENKDVNPFIYGVSDKNVYNIDDLFSIDQQDRIYALNQGVFVENSKQNFNFNNLKKEDVLQLEKPKSNFTVDIPEKFQKKGLLIIDLVSDNKVEKHSFIKINGESVGRFVPIYDYSDKVVNSSQIYFESSKDLKSLKFDYSQNKPNYKSLEIRFIPQSELEKDNYDIVKTTNNHVELNKKFEFDLDMKDNGYLMTTIPYDDGFVIKNNGQVIEKTLMDGYFLGAKLDKGNHHITIEYEIKGFLAGLISTVIGFLILGFIMVKEINWLNRPFFRFVLVGVFNTVNYFIVYSLLLKMIPYLSAHVSAFLFSALISYFLTSLYTFNTKPSWKTLAAFPLTFLPNLIFSSFGTVALVELNVLGKDIASLVMMIVIIPITFIINRIIFVRKKHQIINNEIDEKN